MFGFGGIAHYYGGSDIVHCVNKGSHQFHNFALEHSLFRELQTFTNRDPDPNY